MKGLYWLGTSLDDVRRFPAEVRREIGTELFLVTQKTARSDIDKARARYALIP